MPDIKTCPRCSQTFPLETGFYRNRADPTGYQGYCKECFKTLMQSRKSANPDHIRAIQKAAYERNKGVINPRRNARRRKQPAD